MPLDLSSVPPGYWLEIPSSSMQASGVLPETSEPLWPVGAFNMAGLMKDNNGAFYDPLRDCLVMTAPGGHSSLPYNGVLAFWFSGPNAGNWTVMKRPTMTLVQYQCKWNFGVSPHVPIDTLSVVAGQSFITFNNAIHFTVGDYVATNGGPSSAVSGVPPALGTKVYRIAATSLGTVHNIAACASNPSGLIEQTETASPFLRSLQTTADFAYIAYGVLPQQDNFPLQYPSVVDPQAPISRHTYSQCAAITRGAYAGKYIIAGGAVAAGGGTSDDFVWLFDPDTSDANGPGRWIPVGNLGVHFGDEHGFQYDLGSGLLWGQANSNLVSISLTVSGGITARTEAASFAIGETQNTGSILDRQRQWQVVFGTKAKDLVNPGVTFYDLQTGSPGSRTRVSPTQGAGIFTGSMFGDYGGGLGFRIGYDFDCIREKIVFGFADGMIYDNGVGVNDVWRTSQTGRFSDIFSLVFDETTSPPTWTIQREQAIGGDDIDTAIRSNIDALKAANTYGRFSHVLNHDVYCLAPATTMNMWVYRPQDQSQVVVLDTRSWTTIPQYALGDGPFGSPFGTGQGNGGAKHWRYAPDFRRKQMYVCAGDVRYYATGATRSNGNGDNEVWRGKFGKTWTLLVRGDQPAVVGGVAQVVPDRPDNCCVANDPFNDTLLMVQGFWFGSQAGRNIGPPTFANVTLQNALGATSSPGDTVTLSGDHVTLGPNASYLAPGAIMLAHVNALGGDQECITFSSKALSGPNTVFTITARGAFGTTARSHIIGEIAADKNGSTTYLDYPTGAVSDVGTPFLLNNSTGFWSRGAMGYSVNGQGGDDNATFATFDWHPQGTKSYYRLFQNGGIGLTMDILNRTTDIWSRNAPPSPYRDAVAPRAEMAMDGRGRAIYFVLSEGSIYGPTPTLVKYMVDLGTWVTVSAVPLPFLGENSGECKIGFIPLTRSLLLFDQANPQFGSPTIRVLLYHIDQPSVVFNLPSNPGWEDIAFPSGMLGNGSVVDPWTGVIYWGQTSGDATGTFHLWRDFGGPTTGAIIQPTISVSLVWNGLIRDRVGRGVTQLGSDGSLDGVLTCTLHGGTKTVTALVLQTLTGAPGRWSSVSADGNYVLGAAATFDGAYLNDPSTMAVNFSVQDGSSWVLFASDTSPSTEFVNGVQLQVTVKFSDNSTATAIATVENAVPAPTLTTVSPSSGQAMTSTTLTGTNFGASQGSSSVLMGGSTASVVLWNDTSITVVVPGLVAGTYNVTVTTSGGTSNAKTFTVIPVPTLASVTPTHSLPGAMITLTGTGFGSTQGASTAAIGAVTLSIVSWSDLSIVATVPPLTAAGAYTAVVTTAGGASNGVAFSVDALALTALSPTHGPAGTQVTLTGTGFDTTQGASVVKMGTAVLSIVSWSNSAIVAIVPSIAVASYLVTVTTAASGISNSQTFAVDATPPPPTPVLGAVAPGNGQPGSTVTLTGSNFGASQGIGSVFFTGTPAAIVSWSDVQIVAIVPAVSPGVYNVTVHTSNGTSSAKPFTVNPATQPPMLALVTPSTQFAGQQVTLTGSGFGAAQGTGFVTIAGIVHGSVTSWSDTTIVVRPSNHILRGTYNVTVTNGGVTSGPQRLTIVIPAHRGAAPSASGHRGHNLSPIARNNANIVAQVTNWQGPLSRSKPMDTGASV